MNETTFFIILIVLTIAHVIGDFRTPYRTLDRTSWKTILLSEYVLVLNPMHGLWDRYSPWRRHPRYLQPYKANLDAIYDIREIDIPEGTHIPSWYAQNCLFRTTDQRFWLWLGIDQAYHMLSNVFLAWLVAVLI